MAKKKTNTFLKRVTSQKVVLGFQAIVSAILLFCIVNLSMLPMLYIGAVVLLLLVLMGLSFALTKSKKEKSKKVVFGKFLSVFLSLVMLIGSLSIAKGDSVLGNITGANTQTHAMSTIVLKDGSIRTVKDLKDKTVGISTTLDTENTPKAVEDLNKEAKVKTTEYSDLNTLVQALYDQKVDAIIMNESMRGMLEDDFADFDSKTKVIHQLEIEEKLEDVTKAANVTKETFSIYLSGIDTTGKVSTVSRSDVNMVVTVNPKTKQILLTSIPRDYYVTLASKGAKDKLTHAGLYGVNESIKTIENFMGIEINYYARVNFTSLIKMVDALGGIEVYSDKSFTPYTDQGVYINEGMNHFDGRKALAFARERYAYAEGDNHRVQNQQAVLTAMLDKMMSPAIITNYNSVLNSIQGSFETDMSSNDITSLIKMQLNDMSGWQIMNQQLSGTGNSSSPVYSMPSAKGVYVMIPNQDSITQTSNKINQMVKGEKISA